MNASPGLNMMLDTSITGILNACNGTKVPSTALFIRPSTNTNASRRAAAARPSRRP